LKIAGLIPAVIAVIIAYMPILPVNITREMRIFPSSGIDEVIPVERPTVLKAEIISKITDKNEL
jgi:phenylpyruvate tautomerase PptA (4-oxalocrotonate tautomerase family)